MWRLVFVCILIAPLGIPPVGQSAEFGDIELSVYMLGSWPRDQNVYNQGMAVPASIQQGFGAGLKIGLFPNFTNRVVGIELDSFGHGGALSFPNGVSGQHAGLGRSNLLIFNTMFNLIVRYPGEVLTPYVGIGAGWSRGTLLNPNIAGRADKDFDTAHALGHQYLTGIRVMLNPKVFVFGEYRYVSTNYHWEGLALDFRAHYGLFGVGLHF